MKKRILVFVGGTDGCKLHRLILPYEKIKSENFTIDFLPFTGQTEEELIKQSLECDIFVYHRLLNDKHFEALKGKVVLVNDQDDYWELNTTHPLYSRFRNDLTQKIKYQIINSDYITTTTEIMAKKIRVLNKNVAVFPNALVAEGQFEPHNERSGYIRVGWVGGSSHVADIRMLQGIVNGLPQDVRERVQFVLCGFDGGRKTIVYPDGHTETKQMDYRDTCWGEFERIFTDNYKNVTDKYKDYLLKFVQQDDSDYGERYRRVWTKKIDSYATHYDKLDILLIPLRKDFFNESKSELKFIEGSVKGKSVIISDVEPYKNVIKTAITKGGEIDPEGNCIAIADNKGLKAWIKAITRLVKDDTLRTMIATNLKKLTAEGADFNLNTVCEKRKQWLEKIIENKNII